jgi:hypothetical protein
MAIIVVSTTIKKIRLLKISRMIVFTHYYYYYINLFLVLRYSVGSVKSILKKFLFFTWATHVNIISYLKINFKIKYINA